MSFSEGGYSSYNEDHWIRLELQRKRDEVIKLEKELKEQIESHKHIDKFDEKCIDLVNAIKCVSENNTIESVVFKCEACEMAPCYTVVTYNRQLANVIAKKDPECCVFNNGSKSNWKKHEVNYVH